MRTIIKHKNLTWIDIINPTEADIKYLRRKFKLHPLTIKRIIPSVYHPDLDFFKNYISIILHYFTSDKGSGEAKIHEFDIICGKNYLITNHYYEKSPLSLDFEECLKGETKKREEYMGKGISFFLFMVLNTFLRKKLKKADGIEDEIEEVEREIFLERERKVVKKILHLKRKIINLWRIVKPQRVIFDSLRIVGPKFFGETAKPYFSVLFRTHRRIENALITAKETIESLEETNHILVSLKMNEIIKILTIFSVILLPLTLLASIWGMNTNFLPFEKSMFDFWLIMGLMAIVLAGMIFYFKLRKWL